MNLNPGCIIKIPVSAINSFQQENWLDSLYLENMIDDQEDPHYHTLEKYDIEKAESDPDLKLKLVEYEKLLFDTIHIQEKLCEGISKNIYTNLKKLESIQTADFSRLEKIETIFKLERLKYLEFMDLSLLSSKDSEKQLKRCFLAITIPNYSRFLTRIKLTLLKMEQIIKDKYFI